MIRYNRAGCLICRVPGPSKHDKPDSSRRMCATLSRMNSGKAVLVQMVPMVLIKDD
jgi:hypothetical protein